MDCLPNGSSSEISFSTVTHDRLDATMTKLEQIKDDVKQLAKADQEDLLDWLTNVLEDQLEFTDDFKASIERGEADIAAGRIRIFPTRFY
jgi:predicted transcriptional regulator